MDWHVLFPASHQPRYEEIESYINNPLWKSLFGFMENTYKAKPKMTFSVCSGAPGWNVKFQKSGQALGTFYPEVGGFSVFMVMAYKLSEEAEAILPELSAEVRDCYQNAGDFMKIGKYFMFRIEKESEFEDYKKLCMVKLKPKN
ncbi:MAG: DUF3788 domain-containing protein [Oscillospiraceae bacterium]|jgi:hypothetical protein|nr:DUF3788 domain-containing protein [Oscillospiraceae bacterium]